MLTAAMSDIRSPTHNDAPKIVTTGKSSVRKGCSIHGLVMRKYVTVGQTMAKALAISVAFGRFDLVHLHVCRFSRPAGPFIAHCVRTALGHWEQPSHAWALRSYYFAHVRSAVKTPGYF